jgi:hypothetical protein
VDHKARQSAQTNQGDVDSITGSHAYREQETIIDLFLPLVLIQCMAEFPEEFGVSSCLFVILGVLVVDVQAIEAVVLQEFYR